MVLEQGAREGKLGESKLISFLAKRANVICTLSYVIGVLGFLALPYRNFSENHYHSENALLTGMQETKYGWGERRHAEHVNEQILKMQETSGKQGVQDFIITLMKNGGMPAYRQEFSFKYPLPTTDDLKPVYEVKNGSNVYGYVRAGRAASTESIVLNIPISQDDFNYGIGIALVLGGLIRDQPYWAKDIVLLFSDMGYIGSQAWLQSYYDIKSSDFIKADPLQERAGAILAAVNLETPHIPSYINVEVVGNNGQLPNLDLVNVVAKLCAQYGITVQFGGIPHSNFHDPMENYVNSLKTVLKMMSKQAKGFTDINHSTFLQHNIQSLTIQGKRRGDYGPVTIGTVVELTFRSLNNLLEKLHHSYFFYLISARDRFISIVLYMPALGLILLAPTLKALMIWRDRDKSMRKRNEASQDENEEFPPGMDRNMNQSQNESTLLEVFYKFGYAHILGVLLYYSPSFVTMLAAYGLQLQDGLIMTFLSTFFVTLLLPFLSVSRFTSDSTFYQDVYGLLRIVALVSYSMIIGCTAVMNFSLGMIVAVATVPFITPITSNSKRLKPVFILMALLASPVFISVASYYAEIFIFNGKHEAVWNLFGKILKSAYEQSLLGNSWNYELGCLLLYPNWMLFWFIAIS